MLDENLDKENFSPVETRPVETHSYASLQRDSKPSLISIGDLLSGAWALYKRRAKVLWLILALPAGFNIAYLLVNTGIDSQLIVSPWTLPAAVFAVILALTAGFANLWAALALIFAVKDEIDFKQAFILAWHKLLSYIWLSILSSLVIAGGLMLFFIPGVIFSIWFAFTAYILVVEGLKGRQALLKSKAYVKDYWWPVLGRLVLMGLLVWLAIAVPLGFVSGVIFIISFVVSGFAVSGILQQLLGLLISIVQIILPIFISPFAVVYGFLLYQDTRAKKSDLVFEPTNKDKIGLVLWAVWAIVAVLLIFSLIFAGIWFLMFSNADWAKTFRDGMRQSQQRQIMSGLDIYYHNHQRYPDFLSDLKDVGLTTAVEDPKTRQAYEYQAIENGQDFSLCLDFEKKERECFNKEDIDENLKPWQWQGSWPPEPEIQPQFNFLWIRFANIKTNLYSALIAGRNLLAF